MGQNLQSRLQVKGSFADLCVCGVLSFLLASCAESARDSEGIEGIALRVEVDSAKKGEQGLGLRCHIVLLPG